MHVSSTSKIRLSSMLRRSRIKVPRDTLNDSAANSVTFQPLPSSTWRVLMSTNEHNEEQPLSSSRISVNSPEKTHLSDIPLIFTTLTCLQWNMLAPVRSVQRAHERLYLTSLMEFSEGLSLPGKHAFSGLADCLSTPRPGVRQLDWPYRRRDVGLPLTLHLWAAHLHLVRRNPPMEDPGELRHMDRHLSKGQSKRLQYGVVLH